MTCNIDARGKAVRLIYGIVLVAIAAVLAFAWAWGTASPLRWTVVISCLCAGAVGVFEGWAGWCVVRAMGFKTPI